MLLRIPFLMKEDPNYKHIPNLVTNIEIIGIMLILLDIKTREDCYFRIMLLKIRMNIHQFNTKSNN